MDVTLTEAQARLGELAERAMSGEEVVVGLEDGRTLQLVARRRKPGAVDLEARRRALDALAEAGRKAPPGPSAARSQDFLYDDETGLPA